MPTEITRHYFPKKKRRKPRDSSSRSLAREKAWQACALYIRLRDRKCLMGEMFPHCAGRLNAGHVIPKGKSKFLYFSEDNIFGQCAQHNREHFEGSPDYVAWYIKTFGQDKYLDLVQRSKIFRKDHTLTELRKIKSLYEHKTEELTTA